MTQRPTELAPKTDAHGRENAPEDSVAAGQGNGGLPLLPEHAAALPAARNRGGLSLPQIVALAALTAPALWALGYLAGGSPGLGMWRAVAALLLGGAALALYWRARRYA